MASSLIAYRLRGYAARSTDPTETTLLTPAAGAAHSDQFKVASIAGVTGYQPYLQDAPQGRRGRIDLLTRKLDTGSLAFTLIDKTLNAGDNLTRWWSAFFGDVKGKPPGRFRFEVDETLDGGTTWPLFATMELVGTKMIAKNQIQLQLRDRVETLKMRTFVSQAHASLTYVAQPTLMPIGFRKSDYGLLRKTLPLTGTTFLQTVGGTSYAPSVEMGVKLDATSRFHVGNIMTENLRQILPPFSHAALLDGAEAMVSFPNFNGPLRCHLKRLDTNAEGDFKVGNVSCTPEFRDGRKHWHAFAMLLRELESTDVGYMAKPAAGVNVEVAVFVDVETDTAHPLLINDVDPATYLQDLCAGKFGQMYRPPLTLPPGKSYGDPIRVVPVNTTAASVGCVSDLVGKRPPMRLPVSQPSTCIVEIERVCRENPWAPYLDKSGRLNIADLSLPSSLAGIPTLTDTDIDESDDVEWEHDPTSAMYLALMTQYEERVLAPPQLWQKEDEFPAIERAGIEETKHLTAPLYIGSIDYGEEVLKVDARGYRAMDGEQYQNQPRSQYLESTLIDLANLYARPLGYGLTTIPLRCRRTGTVTGLTPGALVIVVASVVPDPGTHKRGGSVLCRALEISEDGPNINLRLIFMASTAAATAPTLAAPALETGNGWAGVTTAVTVNASAHPVQVRYAITDTSVGVVPADTSPLWTIAGTQSATGTFTIRGVGPGKRVWVQGRSYPQFAVTLELPSAWTNAGGTGRVDTTALPTPSGLTASKTDVACALSWTNGASDVQTEILLATPTGDARVRVGIAQAGSTKFELKRLEPNTTYRAGIRHVVGQFFGTEVTVDFTTDVTGAIAPALVSFEVVF